MTTFSQRPLINLGRSKVATGNLKIIPYSRIHDIVSEGPKNRYPSHIDFNRCREKIASALNDFGNRWCKQEIVGFNALKEWKLSIFNIVDKLIKLYSHNTKFLPPKPKSSFRHLKQDIHKFHRTYFWVPTDKAANNIVVCWLHYMNTLKQELNGTKVYEETATDEKIVDISHSNELPYKFAVNVKVRQDKTS